MPVSTQPPLAVVDQVLRLQLVKLARTALIDATHFFTQAMEAMQQDMTTLKSANMAQSKLIYSMQGSRLCCAVGGARLTRTAGDMQQLHQRLNERGVDVTTERKMQHVGGKHHVPVCLFTVQGF